MQINRIRINVKIQTFHAIVSCGCNAQRYQTDNITITLAYNTITKPRKEVPLLKGYVELIIRLEHICALK